MAKRSKSGESSFGFDWLTTRFVFGFGFASSLAVGFLGPMPAGLPEFSGFLLLVCVWMQSQAHERDRGRTRPAETELSPAAAEPMV